MDCSAVQDGCKLPHSIMHRGRDRHAGGSQRLSRAATGRERRGFVHGDGCQAGGRDNALRKAEASTDLAGPVPVPGPVRSAQGLPVSPVSCAASAAPSGRDRGWGGTSVGDHVPGRPGASAIICGNCQTPGQLRKPECRAKNRFRKVLRHATIGHEGI